MTEFKIQQYYKLLSWATIVIGLAFVLIPTELPTAERIWAAVLLNTGVHMLFQLLSRIPIRMYGLIEKESPRIKKLSLIMFKNFSIATIAMTGLAAIGIVNIIISEADYSKLLAVPVFIGVFLGSLNSWLKLKTV